MQSLFLVRVLVIMESSCSLIVGLLIMSFINDLRSRKASKTQDEAIRAHLRAIQAIDELVRQAWGARLAMHETAMEEHRALLAEDRRDTE